MKIISAPPAPAPRTRQHGVAAIEAAFLLPILIVFITLPLFYARCLWHYTVAQKAAQDAARYLATVPRAEMTSTTLGAAAANRAVDIATREMAELAPGSEIVGPTAICNSTICGRMIPVGSLPTRVTVELGFYMTDPIFNIDLWGPISINASVTMNYVGT